MRPCVAAAFTAALFLLGPLVGCSSSPSSVGGAKLLDTHGTDAFAAFVDDAASADAPIDVDPGGLPDGAAPSVDGAGLDVTPVDPDAPAAGDSIATLDVSDPGRGGDDSGASAGQDTGEAADLSTGDDGEAEQDTTAPSPDTITGDATAPVPDGPPFDMAMIGDPATAACTFTNKHTAFKDGVLLDAWNVSYVSWESIDGKLQAIPIKAFAARPAGKTLIPGIVAAHGLGGMAEESSATGPAALTGAFVIAYTGPGGGDKADNTSGGKGAMADSGYHMFDTLKDIRGTWFWGHAVAGMRGVTCLVSHPEVDPTRIGMTGFSAGGVVTLISSAVDTRIKVAVPLSGTLAWDVATKSPTAWQNELLAKAGLSSKSPEWNKLIAELIAPAAYLAKTNSKILMMDGTTDEFFPLTAFMATYDVIATDKRVSLAANFDHGCYSVSGVESAKTIEERADLRAKGGQRAWFKHHFGTGADYAYYPQPPVVTLQPLGAVAAVVAVVDPGGSKLDVESVKVWWSTDDMFIFGWTDLDKSNGVYSKLAAVPVAPNLVTFVDVQYKTKALIAPERFSVSSPPVIPPGLVPHIRSMGNCL